MLLRANQKARNFLARNLEILSSQSKENQRKNEEDKITNRHVTISERVELMNRSGTGSNIFDIKTIKAFYDNRVPSKE